MTEFLRALDNEIYQALQLAHTALLGRITAISNGRADVRPLAGDLPTLQQVPWISHRYEYTDTGDTDSGSGPTETRYAEGPVYEVGDKVLIVFLEHPRDESGDRGRRLDDGLIVGRVSI